MNSKAKRNRLIIRNIGPIKSVDIALNRVNVFIGPQGSGKSTIAKIISFCSWLEKVNESTDKAISDGLINRMQSYHRLNGFFNEKSQLFYEGENMAFTYNWGDSYRLSNRYQMHTMEHFHDKEFVFYTIDKTINPKVIYIPAERNFVSSVPNLKKYAENDDGLQSFINDWFEAKRHYTREKAFEVLNLDLLYYYNQQNDIDWLKQGKDVLIRLESSSSGYQSVVPLSLLVNWMSSGIYEENKPFSPSEVQRVQEIISHISSSNMSDMELQLIDRLRGFIKGKVYTHTQFVIEEPEQNLFPKTQMDLVYTLLSSINHGRNHRLVMTTHSPYVLYALNNCMLAHLVKNNMSVSEANQLECTNHSIDPEEVSVWSISNGCLRDDKGKIHKTIQDERGLIRENYFNDVMALVMDEFNTLLGYDY